MLRTKAIDRARGPQTEAHREALSFALKAHRAKHWEGANASLDRQRARAASKAKYAKKNPRRTSSSEYQAAWRARKAQVLVSEPTSSFFWLNR